MAQLAKRPPMELLRTVVLASTASVTIQGKVVCGTIVARDKGVVVLEFQGGRRASAFVSDLVLDGFDAPVTILHVKDEPTPLMDPGQFVLLGGRPYRLLSETKECASILPLVDGTMPEPAQSADLVRLEQKRS